MPHSLQHITTSFYGNCICLGPSGAEMFRCAESKMNWYLRKNLAKKVSENPPTIQLLFAPKGSGHHGDPFFLQNRENQCVVCGTSEELTKHHVVPYCYHKFFPKGFTRYGSYDVVMLCEKDHTSYEEHSQLLRKELAIQFNAPCDGVASEEGKNQSKELHRITGLAASILKHGEKIPSIKRDEMMGKIKNYLNKEELLMDDLSELLNKHDNTYQVTPHGQIVVSALKTIDEFNWFMKKWRNHFVETMKPQFLSEYWDPNREFAIGN